MTTILKNTFYKSYDGIMTETDSVTIYPIKKQSGKPFYYLDY